MHLSHDDDDGAQSILVQLVEVSLSVAVLQPWLSAAQPGDGLSIAEGRQVDNRKRSFLWTSLWGSNDAKAVRKRFPEFFFFFLRFNIIR